MPVQDRYCADYLAATREDPWVEWANELGLDLSLARDVFDEASALRQPGEPLRAAFARVAGQFSKEHSDLAIPGKVTQVMKAYRAGFATPGRPRGTSRTSALIAARSKPAPLPETVRKVMDRAFGRSFADVLIHRDSLEVSGSTQAVARGREIFFRKGAFAPGTTDGDHVIAHELAHVVQQTESSPGEALSTQSASTATTPATTPVTTPILEADADRAALAALSGQRVSVAFRSAFGQAQAYRDGQKPPADDKGAEAGKADEAEVPFGSKLGADAATKEKDALEEKEAAAKEAAANAGKPADAGKAANAGKAADAADNTSKAAAPVADKKKPATNAATGGASAPSSGAAGPGGGPQPKTAAAPKKAAPIQGETPSAILASLAAVPASSAPAALGQAKGLSPGALSKQRDEAQEALPKVVTPTGLTAKGAGKKKDNKKGAEPGDDGELIATKVPDDSGRRKDDAKLVAEAPPAPKQSETVLAGRVETSSEDQDKNDPALAKSATRALSGVSAPMGQVPATAADTPQLDLTGAADPAQLESGLAEAQGKTSQAQTRAAGDLQKDFGEKDLFPEIDDEMLEAKTELRTPTVAEVGEVGSAALPPEALASIDAEATPILSEKIGKEQARYAEGQAQYDQDANAAHKEAATDMESLEAETVASQTEAQETADSEVTAARGDWQGELESVQTDFQKQAAGAKTDHLAKIGSEEQAGNKQAGGHIAKAETDAEKQKQDAKDEAAKKKEQASKESSGFVGWVKSKAKSLVDGLKSAVNFIYDNLRKAVKAVFEAAKKLALAAIDLARKAIVALITVYATVLKGFVSIALAAFPEIRDRMRSRIDSALETATNLVNKAAELLKKGVAAIIDFVARTIDNILGLIQDLYNAVFTVIGMIVSGELKELMARLGNLIAAGKTAPGQFETAAYEELLGGNLDQPLSPAELAAAGRTPPGGNTEGYVDPGTDHQDGFLCAPWTDSNVGVDAVASGETLSPELSAQLTQAAGPGSQIEFGESADASRSLEAMLGLEGPQADGKEQGAAYTDGLSPQERAGVKWELMKNGISDWFSQNWPYVLAGGVLGIAGFIIANILTGGAILAALPTVLTVLGYLFIGNTILHMTSHLRGYLQKGWNGDIQGGGKSLAKALALAVVEIVSILTFKVGGAALKGASAAGKGAQAAARGTARVARGVGRAARAGAGYVVKGGKVLLRGAGRGIARGAKRLRELGSKLLSRTRFKGFRIRLAAGRRFIVEGRINPWVKIMEGKIDKIEKVEPGTPGAVQLTDDEYIHVSARLFNGGVDAQTALNSVKPKPSAPQLDAAALKKPAPKKPAPKKPAPKKPAPKKPAPKKPAPKKLKTAMGAADHPQLDAPTWKKPLADPKELKTAIGVADHREYTELVEKLRNDPIVGPSLAKASDEELIAIIGYTGMDYSRLNEALRGSTGDLKKLASYVQHADEGLAKLPNYRGEVYRGTYLQSSELAKYKPGREVIEDAFTSTSKNPSTAFGGNTKFVIESKTGTDVESLSQLGNMEAEVLFRPATRFLVVDKVVNSGVTTIRLKEL